MIGIIGPTASANPRCSAHRRRSTDPDRQVIVLGGNIADARFRRLASSRVAYLPQGLGKNLYPTLSIFENVDFFGRLFGQSREEREWRIKDLFASTDLTPFRDRPAGKLSGGMKQKLGLCCSLIHDPDLLILDEPTTGVDPLARRQFWELIDRIRVRRPSMSVMVATAYMDEAERFDWLVAMNAGKVLATGTPDELKRRTNAATRWRRPSSSLLPEETRRGHKEPEICPWQSSGGTPAIEAHGLTQRFGTFTAVDHVSFRIERGEIFGFLGSNGCGKTTTMKMLTGLLPPTEGTALLFGKQVKGGDVESRRHVGFMSQAFSLYTELTVRQNLICTRTFSTCRKMPPQARRRVARRLRAANPWPTPGRKPAAGHPAAALAGGRRDSRTGDAHPRRADLGRRSGRPRRILGIAYPAVAREWRHDLPFHPFHERGRALRSHVDDARGQGARSGTSRTTGCRSARPTSLEDAFIGYLEEAAREADGVSGRHRPRLQHRAPQTHTEHAARYQRSFSLGSRVGFRATRSG